jgi:hypothetical protein
MFVTTLRPAVTEDEIITVMDHLLAEIRTVEQDIKLAERTALILNDIRHHKKISMATCRPVEAAGLRCWIRYYGDKLTFTVRDKESNAQTEGSLPKDKSVADLIQALTLCEGGRRRLAALNNQYSGILQIAEADSEIRLLAAQIAEIRRRTAQAMTGSDYASSLDAVVKEKFSALCQER